MPQGIKLTEEEREQSRVRKLGLQKARRLANPDKTKEDAKNTRLNQKVNRPKAKLIESARARAKKRETLCTITPEDFEIPEVCPVLGLVLRSGNGVSEPFSPSLDELVHGGGYVPGNVQVVSHAANTAKSNLTPEQLLMLADWIYKTFGS